ncbi:MAG: YgfZ/GcvT domain-containing protein [Caulobacterales bacterium]
MSSNLITLPRSLVHVEGPDAEDFLQGLLTQSVEGMAIGQCVYGALLTPQGKVSADMIVWRSGTAAFLLDVAEVFAPALVRRLSLYKLRAQVEIAVREGLAVVAGLGIAQPSSMPRFSGIDPRMPDGALGWRFLMDGGSAFKGDLGPYESLRLEVGIPDLCQDAAPEEVFGLEALLEELNGVDFQKGCFVGQENVSRMKRRATTRKKFCPVVFDGAVPVYGTPITADGVELGSVRFRQAGRALALMRLDRALEARDNGQTLMADETVIRLDPPAWLILPAEKDTV